jgi:hypothetical protein
MPYHVATSLIIEDTVWEMVIPPKTPPPKLLKMAVKMEL